MAVITPSSIQGAGAQAITYTVLGASDTFVFNPARNPILVLKNITGGALTPNIDGASGTVVPVDGIGNVTVSSGYTTPSIPAGGAVAIPLRSIREYLKGVITVTGGTGIQAYILEQ